MFMLFVKINFEYSGNFFLSVLEKLCACKFLAAKLEILFLDTCFNASLNIFELCPIINYPAHNDKSKNFFFL